MINVSGNGEVEFQFFRPAAQQVALVGDFSSWDTSVLPMRRRRDGWWVHRLRLAPGVYQFKYLADGEWYPDYAAFGLERGGLGVWNSVLLVGPPEEADLHGLMDLDAAERDPSSTFATTADSVATEQSWQPSRPPYSLQEV